MACTDLWSSSLPLPGHRCICDRCHTMGSCRKSRIRPHCSCTCLQMDKAQPLIQESIACTDLWSSNLPLPGRRCICDRCHTMGSCRKSRTRPHCSCTCLQMDKAQPLFQESMACTDLWSSSLPLPG